jgi:hypothetical protein
VEAAVDIQRDIVRAPARASLERGIARRVKPPIG